MTKTIITIVLFVIAGAVFFGYTKPTYDQVRSDSAKLQRLEQLLTQRKAFDVKKAQLISMLNAFPPENILRLKRLLPDHVDNVRLILDLDSMASRYGMSIQDVTINRAESSVAADSSVLGAINAQTSIYDSLTMQFSMRGTYANFVSFMNDLESSLRLVDVETITLNPDTSVLGGEPFYRISVTVRTYWLK